MSVEYRAVQWNRAKLVYDAVLFAAVALFIGGFTVIAWRLGPPPSLPGALGTRFRRLRLSHAGRGAVDRPAGAAQSPLPAAPLQPAPFRGVDLLRRGDPRLVPVRLLLGAERFAETRRAIHELARLREIHRLPLQDARPRRAADPVPDGIHQPRFLAEFPV